MLDLNAYEYNKQINLFIIIYKHVNVYNSKINTTLEFFYTTNRAKTVNFVQYLFCVHEYNENKTFSLSARHALII